jgi:hypothetical protein
MQLNNNNRLLPMQDLAATMMSMIGSLCVNSLGVQVPDGADHAPFRVSHTEKGAPVVAPVQVAVHRV